MKKKKVVVVMVGFSGESEGEEEFGLVSGGGLGSPAKGLAKGDASLAVGLEEKKKK